MHGIKKPSYHAYAFLNRLGATLLEKGEDYILTRRSDGKISGLYYHYPEEMTSTVPIAEYPCHDKAEAIQETGSPKRLAYHMEADSIIPPA